MANFFLYKRTYIRYTHKHEQMYASKKPAGKTSLITNQFNTHEDIHLEHFFTKGVTIK